MPLILEFPVYFSGGANLKSSRGGLAYGIPRYSDTFVVFEAVWPLTCPLVVLTVGAL